MSDLVPAGRSPFFRSSPFLDAVSPPFMTRDERGIALGLRVKHTTRTAPAAAMATRCSHSRIWGWGRVLRSPASRRFHKAVSFAQTFLIVGERRVVRANATFRALASKAV